MGKNPEEILSKDALFRGNITEAQDQTQNHQLSILAEQLKQIVRKEATEWPKHLVPFLTYVY